MSKDVNRFIEKNINLIEHGMYHDLYEEAYEWLSDENTSELTRMLQDALNVDLTNVALDVVYNHFETELNNFVIDYEHTELHIASFTRLYMNHLCGISISKFTDYIIQNPPTNKSILITSDSDGLIIKRKG